MFIKSEDSKLQGNNWLVKSIPRTRLHIGSIVWVICAFHLQALPFCAVWLYLYKMHLFLVNPCYSLQLFLYVQDKYSLGAIVHNSPEWFPHRYASKIVYTTKEEDTFEVCSIESYSQNPKQIQHTKYGQITFTVLWTIYASIYSCILWLPGIWLSTIVFSFWQKLTGCWVFIMPMYAMHTAHCTVHP